MQYWFDGQHDNLITSVSSTSSWQSLIETSQLPSGLHTLFLQVQDSTGKWYPPCSYLFYRISNAEDGNSVQYSYWFDNNHTQVQTDSTTTGNLLLDAGMLTTGLHTITFQFNFQSHASFKRYLFYKTPDTHSDSVEYVVWFDHDYAHLLSGHTLSGHLLLDVDSLSNGIHTLNAQFRSGEYHTFKSSLFYKAPAAIGDSVEYVFWFDQDQENRMTGYASNSTLLLDVDSLSSGFHTLNAQFGSGDNITFRSFVFYKRPYDENKIVKYEYWLNDLDSLKQSVSVSPQDTVEVVSMLSVPSLPIRSQRFHFNPNNGVPLIHAQNDIHLRFYNAVGRYATKARSYVDLAAADTVYADTIERNTTKIVAAPTNNAIRWFKLGAGAGDSLSFKVDKPCTMQLYSPDGEMLFHVSNDSVLTWNSCRAGEQGDYYLAVHDAEDTGTISVSYQWIYRYAVLAWDVHRVGNGGVSTITFEGNGFSSLDTMFLVRGTDTIPTLDIERVGNAIMSVFFDFEGVDTGMYNGVFVYTDESLYQTDVVYVEEARPIVLQTTCTYPTAFLRGSTVTFTYTITNTGNMTAYNVPIHAYIGTPSNDGISHIKVSGLGLPSIIAGVDLDSLSADEVAEFEAWAEEMGDDHYFFRFRTIDEDTGDSVFVRSNYFLVTLNGYETKTIQFQITSTDSVDVWCMVPDSLATLTIHYADSTNLAKGQKGIIEGFADWYCCHVDQISCVLDLISGLLDITPGFAANVASCLVGTLGNINSDLSDGCGNYSSVANGWHSIFDRIHVFETGVSLVGTFTTCVLVWGGPEKKLSKIVKLFDDFLNQLDAYMSSLAVIEDCVGAFFTKIHHDCPQCHGENCGGGGVSAAVYSLDPNEITGYLAESGSHAVSAEQVEMPYMIEFENDTLFATAPAHKVVVKDTLDGGVFDLDSFSATSFGFGEHLEMVNGEQSFTRFVDMRPDIGVVAQVQLDYRIDTTFAVATWTFLSLDTMSWLPVVDPTVGFLPINFNGDGVGEVHFTINRKAYLPDSTFISNRAWITFDNEAPIPTSVWTNIVDNTPPEGWLVTFTDSIGENRMKIVATDNLSGVWRYDLYGQRGDVSLLLNAYVSADSSIAVDPSFDYDSYYSRASDSAGNRGKLELFIPQYTLTAVCADPTMGSIAGAGSYTDADTALLIAQANCGFHFLHWADNVTDNPRQVVVQSDTTLIAVFEADSSVVLFETHCGSYTWQNGMTYLSSGIYYDTLTNVMGCDSIVTLHLTVNYPVAELVEATACDSYQWYDSSYTESDDYTLIFTAINGCDSVVTLHLTISESPSPMSISGETEICRNQFATYYYDISNPCYHYKWFKNDELCAENVSEVTLREMDDGNVILKMQVTDDLSGCDADTSLLVQVVNRVAPDTTEIRRKVNTNILVCHSVNSDYGEVHYRWGYTDLQTSDEVVMPGDHNYCLYDFGIDTLSFLYWVETYLNNAMGEGCENRSYYGHGYGTSVSDYNDNVVDAYLSNDRIVLHVSALSPDDVSAALFNMNGQLLLTREYGISDRLSDVIPVSISPGIYLFKVSIGELLYSFKLLKI